MQRAQRFSQTLVGNLDIMLLIHARIQKVFSNFDYVFFFFFWWREKGSKYHCKRAIIGPPVKRHLNGVSLADRLWPNIECWLGSFVVFQGIRTSIGKKSYIFVIPPPLRTCDSPRIPSPDDFSVVTTFDSGLRTWHKGVSSVCHH